MIHVVINVRRAVTALVIMACLVAALATAGLYAAGVHRVCPTEDSVSCVWFGPLQGNHRGAIVINGPEQR